MNMKEKQRGETWVSQSWNHGEISARSVLMSKKFLPAETPGISLLIPGGEILLGKMFVRGGAGEFRATVQTDNIGGNGIEMDLCYGLAIHEPEETWRTYRTIWEDEVAYAAEIELTKAKPQEEISVEENAKKIIEEIEEVRSGKTGRCRERKIFGDYFGHYGKASCGNAKKTGEREGARTRAA